MCAAGFRLFPGTPIARFARKLHVFAGVTALITSAALFWTIFMVG